MAYEFQDSFADTSGTALGSHTPTKVSDDTGTSGSWTVDAGTWKISSANRLRGAEATTNRCRCSVTPSAEDVPIRARVRVVTVPGVDTLFWRLTTHATSASSGFYGYGFEVASSALVLKVWKNQGSDTVVGSVTGAGFSAGNDYDLSIDNEESGGDLILNLTVTRTSDGKYLKPDGSWQTDPIVAITYTDDTPITDSGVGVQVFDFDNDAAGLHFDYLTIGTEVVAATAFTLAAPTLNAGSPGRASQSFALEPNGTFSGTITPSDGGAGGTFTPSSRTWSAEAGVKTFTYTPAAGALGTTVTIAATDDGGLSDPSAVDYDVRTGQVVLDGNSQFARGTQTVPQIVAGLLGGNWIVQGFGVAGQETPDMIADYSSQIASLYNPSLSRNTLVALEIENDLLYRIEDDSQDAATAAGNAYDHVETYGAAALLTGWRVAWCTCLPRSDFVDGGDVAVYDAAQALVNAEMVTNRATICHELIRLDTDARFNDETNLTYYTADLVHLNDTGLEALAEKIVAVAVYGTAGGLVNGGLVNGGLINGGLVA